MKGLRKWRNAHPGQATVEFAFAGFVFLLIVFGTVDLGRAIFFYSQLHNAVGEATREARREPRMETPAGA